MLLGHVLLTNPRHFHKCSFSHGYHLCSPSQRAGCKFINIRVETAISVLWTKFLSCVSTAAFIRQGELRSSLISPYSGTTKTITGQEAQTWEKKWVKTTFEDKNLTANNTLGQV